MKLASSVVLVSLLASGCGKECTLLGCSDSITIALPSNALAPGTSYTFRFCLDTTCTNGTVSPASSGASCRTDLWGFCTASVGNASSVTVTPNNRALLADGMPRPVSFEISAPDRKVAQTQGTVSFQVVHPNGSGCDPACHQGTLPAQ